MRTALEVFRWIMPELETLIAKTPHAFVGTVVVVEDRIDDVRLLLVSDVDEVLACFPSPPAAADFGSELRKNRADGMCPVVIVTSDRTLHASGLEWAKVLAHSPSAPSSAS